MITINFKTFYYYLLYISVQKLCENKLFQQQLSLINDSSTKIKTLLFVWTWKTNYFLIKIMEQFTFHSSKRKQLFSCEDNFSLKLNRTAETQNTLRHESGSRKVTLQTSIMWSLIYAIRWQKHSNNVHATSYRVSRYFFRPPLHFKCTTLLCVARQKEKGPLIQFYWSKYKS